MSERKIKNLLRIEMNRRMAFLRAKELRDRADEKCAKTFKALQRAKRDLFLAGFKGNIMRGVETLSDLLKKNPHDSPFFDELETVGHLWEYAEYYRDDRGWYGYVKVITEENPAHHVSPIEKVRHHDELVTRQNAEEVIAAERLKLESTAKVGLRLSKQVEALEADNTAKDARIAELENYAREATKVITSLSGGGSENFNNPIGDVYPADLPYCLDRIRQRYIPKVKLKHLEADNKRLREALEPFAEYGEDYFDKDHNGNPLPDEQGVGWIYMNFGNFRKARAALGEVKS